MRKRRKGVRRRRRRGGSEEEERHLRVRSALRTGGYHIPCRSAGLVPLGGITILIWTLIHHYGILKQRIYFHIPLYLQYCGIWISPSVKSHDLDQIMGFHRG